MKLIYAVIFEYK